MSDVEAYFDVIRAAFDQLGWNMTPVHSLTAALERLEEQRSALIKDHLRIKDALERAERERDDMEKAEGWAHEQRKEAEARAQKAEAALRDLASMERPADLMRQIALAALDEQEQTIEVQGYVAGQAVGPRMRIPRPGAQYEGLHDALVDEPPTEQT